jgi:hypothetical protein
MRIDTALEQVNYRRQRWMRKRSKQLCPSNGLNSLNHTASRFRSGHQKKYYSIGSEAILLGERSDVRTFAANNFTDQGLMKLVGMPVLTDLRIIYDHTNPVTMLGIRRFTAARQKMNKPVRVVFQNDEKLFKPAGSPASNMQDAGVPTQEPAKGALLYLEQHD